MKKPQAIIIGAGPAGLTAAYELLQRTRIKPVILEATDQIGGISQTVNYKGNRIDIGGHRFFSKSARVMRWWQDMLPLQGAPARDDLLLGRTIPIPLNSNGPDPEKTDPVMLIRGRSSRILFGGNFFDYPLKLSIPTLARLGPIKVAQIGSSYLQARLRRIVPERSLEDFFVNRFGKELYRTFFEHYTEKVWGVPCSAISPEWGAQRVKGLSVSSALLHALKSLIPRGRNQHSRNIETSLIGQFYYPKLGPGQLWEEVARKIVAMGGEIHLDCRATKVYHQERSVTGVAAMSAKTRKTLQFDADYIFSTMPIAELAPALGTALPEEIRKIAQGLVYRDFMMVGLVVDSMERGETGPVFPGVRLVKDNWIYIQESQVKMGRLQVYNNWSPYMVADPHTAWLGLEYFCNEGDELWYMDNARLAEFAAGELATIGLIKPEAVRDSTVLRMPKAYPAYFGTYSQLSRFSDYLERFTNLFLIGRNGMHKYNNMDHSMLTAMTAVENIVNGILGKSNIWSVNTEEEYSETKQIS